MSEPTSHKTKGIVDHLFRNEAGKMTAILIRLFGFNKAELAEDIVQETFISAMKNWPLKGKPENPSAWLMQVAKNKAINVLKRDQLIQSKESDIEPYPSAEEVDRIFLDHEITDSQLRMLFTCCYQEIKPREQVMLILNILGGLNTAEIGSALLLTPEAVKKAIFRAKNKVRKRHQKLPVITKQDISEKYEVVLTAIYLIFNEGYRTSFSDTIVNDELCLTALRLAHLMLNLKGINAGEVHALLSLIYFNIARFEARKEGSEMVDLKTQDRNKWDAGLISKGFHHLEKSRSSFRLSHYHLESSIASVHCSAQNFEETDWQLISRYYKMLLEIKSSPIIQINYATAVSYWEGPEVGLRNLDKIEYSLAKEKKYLLSAAIAEMNARLENFGLAKSYYLVASDQANSKPDIEYLLKKAAECDRKSFSKN